MNIKLNNDETSPDLDDATFTSAEERRRTGRIIAIIVGISLVCLAMYHAWVRKVPVLASLLLPALIMLLYIAWVLYTASKDKKKEEDLEADLESAQAPVQAEAPKVQVQVQVKKPEKVEKAEKVEKVEPKPHGSPKRFRRCYSIA